MKKNKGITLIALVVTIIILLILAGVAISQLTDSGLFEKTKLAKENAKNAQDLENTLLGQYENGINEYVGGKTRDMTYCTTPATTTSTASITNPCVVIENYRNGTEWYRIWSDGWIEQGGYKTATGKITFLKQFSDSNYTVTGGLVPGDATQTWEHLNLCNFSSTGFTFNAYDGYKLKWYACGY